MKVIDRHIFRELLRFALLALLSVVVVYLLIDLFEELNYFTSRKAGLIVVLRYYLYSLPAAVTLLYPVSMVLSVFMTYGHLTRYRELNALKSAGVSTWRLFTPAVAFGLVSTVVYLAGNEWISVPFNRQLSDLRRYVIERRSAPPTEKRQDVYYAGEGRVLFAREMDARGILSGFTLIQLLPSRRAQLRVDGRSAEYRDGSWIGSELAVRRFGDDGAEQFGRRKSAPVGELTESPAEFASPDRPVDETSTGALARHVRRMKAAGENVAAEEVEYHYRFSYSLTGLVMVLLGLPLAVRLRRGGVMFGLGLGLLFSFLYWGAIQTCRAFGASHVVSPALAAWLPNAVFGVVALALLFRAES